MNKGITYEQVMEWLDGRMAQIKGERFNESAFKLGMLGETFRSLLNNPHQRKDLIKEITNEKPRSS